MKIAIVGSREYHNKEHIATFVDSLPDDAIIVSGGARGVDRYAIYCAVLRGLKTIEIYPDWHTYGASAGVIRNGVIVAQADMVAAFWDGKSKGTQDTINRAKGAGVPVVINPTEFVAPPTQTSMF